MEVAFGTVGVQLKAALKSVKAKSSSCFRAWMVPRRSRARAISLSSSTARSRSSKAAAKSLFRPRIKPRSRWGSEQSGSSFRACLVVGEGLVGFAPSKAAVAAVEPRRWIVSASSTAWLRSARALSRSLFMIFA